MKQMIISIIVLFFLFFFLHATPTIALRTHLFFMGYPSAAFTTEIIEDDFYKNADEELLKELAIKSYALTEPPIEEATQGILRNFIVKKKGFLYFAEYYGDA